MDCYIRERDWRVFIVDFNVFGGLTQPLLFAWDELLAGTRGLRFCLFCRVGVFCG
jgi:hypothetical protein